MTQKRRVQSILLVVLLLPILAACGGGNTGSSSPASASSGASSSSPASASSGALGSSLASASGSLSSASPSASAASSAQGSIVPTAAGSPGANASGTATADETATGGAGSTDGADYAALIGQKPSVDTAPAAFNADQARQFQGSRVRYYGDTVGVGAELDQALAQRFAQDTGINVEVVPKPQSATEAYSTYQRFFQAKSADVDVMMLDIIWPAAFGPNLADLSQAMGQEAQQHYPGIIENNTIDGRLVAMPWFGDVGMMYYRTDLLEKYGFNAPPKTWDELQQQAQTIQQGEQDGGNANFAGFVFQGNSYEGLTCNALEWLASSGTNFVDENGQVTVNTPQAVEVMNKIRGFVGTISPRGVTTYQEDQSSNVFTQGNAAFLRNWPYQYALAAGADSPVAGKFDVAPLPTLAGNEQTVGTVGGWQLAVSEYSQNKDAAIEFVRYMTSPEVQTYRAVTGSYVPTIESLAQDPAVLEALPFLENLADVQRVTRPSRQTGQDYNQVSTIIFQGMNQILNGQDAAEVLPNVERQLQRFIR